MNPTAKDFVPKSSTRKHPPLSISTSSNTSSAFPSNTSATSLFPPSTGGLDKSFIATQSAGMPPKMTWESYMQDSSANNDFVAPVGLGLNIDTIANLQNNGASPARDLPKVNVNSRTPTVHDSALPNANTFPLQQYPFGTPREAANQPRILPDRLQQSQLNMRDSTEGSKIKRSDAIVGREALPGLSNSNAQTSGVDRSSADIALDESKSDFSVISPHYLEQHPELVGAVASVFRQDPHPRSFKRLGMKNVEVEEAYDGAHGEVCGFNPDFYQMPYGTRVINAKTDFVQNIHFAVQKSLWSTVEKVSRRIMQVWYSRKNDSEKVLFLFAVNGTKQFCGLAEMAGPWDPRGKVDGWCTSASGAGCVGTIPLTWIYIKNVKYEGFVNLRQERNGQPVVNMWNGMHFDSDTGRKVVELYISSPHFTNVLAWPKDDRYNAIPSRNPARAHDRNHGLVADRRKNGDVENVSAIPGRYATAPRRNLPALTVTSWREPPSPAPGLSSGQVLGEVDENEPTPVAPRQILEAVKKIDVVPLRYDGSVEASVAPRPGDIVPCIVDKNGNLVPVTPPQRSPTVSLPPREYIHNYGQLMRNVGDTQANTVCGAYRGGFSRRGGVRGAKSFAHSPNLRGTQQGQQCSAGHQYNYKKEVSNPDPFANTNQVHMKTQNPAASSYQPLQHAASVMSMLPQARQAFTKHHAVSSPDILSDGTGNIKEHLESKVSDPSLSMSANSPARCAPQNRVRLQPDLKNKQDCLSKKSHEQINQEVQDWFAKTPETSIHLQSIEGDGIPNDYMPIYYRLVASKEAVHHKKQEVFKAGDEGQYLKLLADEAELDTMISNLTVDDSGSTTYSDRELSITSRVSSDDGDSTFTSSSIQRFNISPVRAKDGRVLPSISMVGGSPRAKITRKGMRFKNFPYDAEMERDYGKNIKKFSSTPSSSVQSDFHRSSTDTESAYDASHDGGVDLTD